MRPKILDQLFKPIETTRGIGPRLKIRLEVFNRRKYSRSIMAPAKQHYRSKL